MPELPEVEVVRRGLEAHATGRTVLALDVLHPRLVRRDPGGVEGFRASLIGRRLAVPRRRGKYLWVPLDNGDALLAHLGMSGQILVQPSAAADERHLRVRMRLDDGQELRFVDQRMFGGLSTSPGGAELPPEIAHIARDLLDEQFDLDDFVARVRGRQSGIKRLLLDQNLVSGVGNIYADEALWRARLHGEHSGDRLSARKIRELAQHAREVMESALVQGGTSFDSLYVNVNGESGYFARSLHAYGREGEACERCGTPIRRAAFMNRSSYFCPRCQRNADRLPLIDAELSISGAWLPDLRGLHEVQRRGSERGDLTLDYARPDQPVSGVPGLVEAGDLARPHWPSCVPPG